MVAMPPQVMASLAMKVLVAMSLVTMSLAMMNLVRVKPGANNKMCLALATLDGAGISALVSPGEKIVKPTTHPTFVIFSIEALTGDQYQANFVL